MSLNKTRVWIGSWLLGVAALHTLFAILVFHTPMLKLWQLGVFDAVGEDPLLGAVTWFFLFGAAFALFGLAVQQLERAHLRQGFRALGWGLLLLCGLGIVLMPASGFWTALPAAWGLLKTAPHTKEVMHALDAS